MLVTYAVNYAIGGLTPAGYTMVNIALHAAVSVLLFALVRRIGGSLLAAGAAGLVFAVHPVHSEAVIGGISGRPELLAALFVLLALHLHRLAPANRSLVNPGRIGTLLCFACALLSKESAITLLLVLPVLDRLLPAPARRRVLTDYLPLAGVAAVYLVVRYAVLGGITIDPGVIAPLDNPLVRLTTLPLGERLGATTGQAVMTACAVVVEYARLLVWPAHLSPDYSYNQIPLVTNPLDGRFLGGLALIAACLAGIAVLWRRRPIAAFGLAFLALTFSVVSNLAVTIGTICAERLLYLPSAGAIVAAAVGLDAVAGTTAARRRLACVALAAVTALGAARTWARNRDWKDDAALWSAAVQVAPDSARVQSEYGRVLMNQGEDEAQAGRAAEAEQAFARARGHFERALQIYPSYSPPMDGLATLLSLHQHFDEALTLYERAVKVWPGKLLQHHELGGAAVGSIEAPPGPGRPPARRRPCGRGRLADA